MSLTTDPVTVYVQPGDANDYQIVQSPSTVLVTSTPNSTDPVVTTLTALRALGTLDPASRILIFSMSGNACYSGELGS